MAVFHRTKRLRIYGKKPEVTQLFGGRYAMTVRCQAKNDTEAWYDKNKDQIFADFGTLYDAHMAVDGIDARTGEAYTDMVLTSVGAGYTQTGEYVITFNYQTLTGSFVEEAAEKVDVELNGLRRVIRRLIAKDGTSYSKTVGTTTISHSGIGYSAATLTLAQATSGTKGPNESGFVSITETWLESGVISRTINEGRGGTGTGKIRTETVEAFNQTPTSTISGVEISVSTSNVEGINTIRKTFATGAGEVSRNVETRNNGKLTITTVESLGSAGSASGVEIEATTSEQDGYTLFRNVFAQSDGEIRRTDRPGPSAIPGTTYVTIDSVGTAITPSGTLIDSTETQENGYVRFSRTALQGTIIKTTQTYKDVVFVDVPGRVNCTTSGAIAIETLGEATDATGAIIGRVVKKPKGETAIVETIPPTKQQVEADVVVNIQSSIPDTTELAFDISGLSCSVVKLTERVSGRVGRAVTLVASDGSTTTEVGSGQSFSTSSSFTEFPRHFIQNSNAEAIMGTTSSTQPYISGGQFEFATETSETKTRAVGFGNSFDDKADLYKTDGIISRSFRPVLTAQDGTVFYEVTTVSATVVNRTPGLDFQPLS